MKKIICKFITIILFILIVFTFLFSINASAIIERVKWGEVQNKENVLVYKLGMSTPYKTEHLHYNEFVLYDEVHTFYLEILHAPPDLMSVKLNLKILSTSERKIYEDNFTYDSPYSYTYKTVNFQLNESGLWFWILLFEVNRNESYNNKEEISLIEYHGDSKKLNDDSIVEVLENEPWGNIGLYQNVEFKRAFIVYTQSESAQVMAARALETAALYQQDAAETAKDNLIAQYIVILVLAFTAVLSLGATIYSRYQMKKERKRPAIIRLIVEAIDTAILEFNKLSTKLERIQKIIETTDEDNIPIIVLPSVIYRYHLSSSSWKDFEKEFPNLCSQIQEYLLKKEQYITLRENCIRKIVEFIKKVEIDKEMDLAIGDLRKASRTRGANIEYLHKDLSRDLAGCILSLDNVGNQAPLIFNRFKDRWLQIRKEKQIKQQIDNLSKILIDLLKLKYKNFYLEAEKLRKKIMKDYDIYNGTLKEYLSDKEKERLDYSVKSQQSINIPEFKP